MTLPAGWTTRRPTLDDVPAILAVVHAADTFAIGHPDFDAEDVAASLTAPYFDPARDSWLAVDPEGDVVGWATVDNPTGVGREFVEIYVDPVRAATVRAPLLARQLDRVAERAADRGCRCSPSVARSSRRNVTGNGACARSGSPWSRGTSG